MSSSSTSLDYLEEAAQYIRDQHLVHIAFKVDVLGIRVVVSGPRGFRERIIDWQVLRLAVINPLIRAIEDLKD